MFTEQAARKNKHIIPIVKNKWKFSLPATRHFYFNRHSGMYKIGVKIKI